MADDDQGDRPRPPTEAIEDFRAFLAAVRSWEATTRPELMPPTHSQPHAAYEMAYIFAARVGLFLPHPDYMRPHDALARVAAARAWEAVLDPIRTPWWDRSPPMRLGYTPGSIPELTEAQRATLRGAIDALAAAVDLLDAFGRMTTDDREAVEEAARGRPRTNEERDASAWAMRHPEAGVGAKWSVIASTLGYTDSNHARKSAGRWAERRGTKGT